MSANGLAKGIFIQNKETVHPPVPRRHCDFPSYLLQRTALNSALPLPQKERWEGSCCGAGWGSCCPLMGTTAPRRTETGGSLNPQHLKGHQIHKSCSTGHLPSHWVRMGMVLRWRTPSIVVSKESIQIISIDFPPWRQMNLGAPTGNQVPSHSVFLVLRNEAKFTISVSCIGWCGALDCWIKAKSQELQHVVLKKPESPYGLSPH